jgi:hypothetical protein
MRKLILATGVTLAFVSSSLFAAIVTVDARDDIFEAGLGTPGTAVGSNMGLFPVLALSFGAGSGQTVSFNSVAGKTVCGTTTCGTFGPLPGGIDPDGASTTGLGTGGTAITSNTGISGITFGRQMFLVGVFLTDAAPTSGTQPGSLTFFTSGGGLDTDNRVNWFDPSTTFAIGQTFYIGDGKTGFNNAAGTTQVWNVPTNATRLYLGFVDGGSGGPFQGSFGAYDDNLGSVAADINFAGAQVPEPGTLALMGLGLFGVAFLRKRLVR